MFIDGYIKEFQIFRNVDGSQILGC